jgi:hypothetical protein
VNLPMAGTSALRLRRELVEQLHSKGVIRSDSLKAAFLTVPRELFVPGVAADDGLEAVYRDDEMVTKRDPRGMPLSSSSQPALMAEMLELLAIRAWSPGTRDRDGHGLQRGARDAPGWTEGPGRERRHRRRARARRTADAARRRLPRLGRCRGRPQRSSGRRSL